MIISHTKEDLQNQMAALKSEKMSVGFVPTMGALHQGHLSLIKQALVENDQVVVSIFVNPTQFDNPADLEKYPRTLERDLELLASVSDRLMVYVPSNQDLYGDQLVAEQFDFDGLERQMEGQFREGHFDGVGTVVKRLFQIVQPDAAYFGKKDYQQLKIIQKLVEKHGLQVRIVGCEIYREEDGLAMSSRNERLSPLQRKAAPFIYQTLLSAKTLFGTKNAEEVADWVKTQFQSQDLMELEYFIIADDESLQPLSDYRHTNSYRAFVAVHVGDIRLIDNIALN